MTAAQTAAPSERAMTGGGSHARDRYCERYGTPLTEAALRELEWRLRKGEGMVIRRHSDGSEVRAIPHRGQIVTLAYDPKTFWIKTFLPGNAALKGQRGRDRRIAKGDA